MTNIIVVLLFVLFPPADVVREHPDAQPLIQSVQTAGVEDCKAKAEKLIAIAKQDFADAEAHVGYIAVPAPAPKVKDSI